MDRATREKDVTLPKERVERDEEDLVRLYLTDIGQYPLLTKDDEVRLAQAIEAGQRGPCRARGRGTVLSPRPSASCAARRDGEDAERTFVQSNLRLVVSIAKKYQASGLPLLDLIQEGNLGLMHAVEKFDWRKGFKFSTYATWWIRQAITRGIANTGRTIRLPSTPATRWPACRRHGPGSSSSSAARPPWPSCRPRWRCRRTRSPRRCASPPSRCRCPSRCARTATPSWATWSRTARPSRRSRWRPPPSCPRRSTGCWLRSTSASARSSSCASGSTGASPRTLEEVGEHFNLTRERIRQIEARAMSKLRHPSSDTGARDLLAV